MRRFLDRHRPGTPPYPTARGLYAEFLAESPDSLHPVLRAWFEEVTLWHLRADSARVDPDYRLIDREWDDNVVKVEGPSAPRS